MDSYTITIAPNDDSGAATRLVVDTSGDQVRITDVHLHAPLGLSSGHIPTVDFALLLQAVTGSSGQTAAAGATALVASQPSTPAIEAAPEPQPPAPRRRARKATPAIEAAPEPPAPRRRARKATPAVEAAPAKRAARPRTAKAAPVAEPRRRARTAKQAPAAPAKKQTASRTKVPAASGRVYRRTPDDLAEVFEQVETVAGIAEHYEVPRYTAQGWVNRLRATA